MQTQQELERLVKGLAMTGASKAITDAIAEREASIAALRSRLDEIHALGNVEFEKLIPEVIARVSDWRSYLRSNPIGVTQQVLKAVVPEKVRFTPGEHGTWTFQGARPTGSSWRASFPNLLVLDQVRAGDQHENLEGARADGSPDGPLAGGPSIE